jgi:hypothetical protein
VTITSIIAESVKAALDQVAPTANVDLISKAIAANAAQSLRTDPVPAWVEMVRAIGAAEVTVTVRPDGYSARIVCESVSAAADIATLLGLGAPVQVNNGERQWHVSEGGDWETGDYVCVLGPSEVMCGCGRRVA